MNKYSIFSLARNAMSYHQNWSAAWRSPEPTCCCCAATPSASAPSRASPRSRPRWRPCRFRSTTPSATTTSRCARRGRLARAGRRAPGALARGGRRGGRRDRPGFHGRCLSRVCAPRRDDRCSVRRALTFDSTVNTSSAVPFRQTRRFFVI